MIRDASQPSERPPGSTAVFLPLFALCGFAIAQPLLDILGRAPTFFAAHGASRATVITFVLVTILLPPVLLWLAVRIVRLVNVRAGELALAALAGALVSLAIVPHLSRTLDLQPLTLLMLCAAVSMGTAFAYARSRLVRLFARTAAFAPVVVGGLFVGTSPASMLVMPAATVSEPVARGDANVLVLVLDELPLAALLGAGGELDGARFPNFERLASMSTWYRQATTVSPWTHLAVPAILSGLVPDREAPPVRSTYPRNLFTMLGRTHRMSALEGVAKLCPGALCEPPAAEGVPVRSLYRDASVVLLHAILPDGFAERWLPPIGDRWAGFDRTDADGEVDDWRARMRATTHADQVVRFGAFLNAIRASGGRARRQLWFGHILLPHLPLRYHPDGTEYAGLNRPPGLGGDWVVWGPDQRLVDAARARFMLQLQFTDALVGLVLDTLEQLQQVDSTMIVVTSDHGLSFRSGFSRRASPLEAVDIAAIAAVPLFVKYPGPRDGTVDDRVAEITDVLPTIAEALDVDVPEDWVFDGTSLLATPSDDRKRQYVDPAGHAVLPHTIDLRREVATYHALFGAEPGPYDLYGWGPLRHLVGQERGAFRTVAVPARARLLSPRRLHIDASARGRASLLTIGFSKLPEGAAWALPVVNGRISGVGPIYDRNRTTVATVLIEPSSLRTGPNELEVLVARATGEVWVVPR